MKETVRTNAMVVDMNEVKGQSQGHGHKHRIRTAVRVRVRRRPNTEPCSVMDKKYPQTVICSETTTFIEWDTAQLREA